MANRNTPFTTIRTEGALLPADLLQRISQGANLDGLTAESYHHPGEKLNEAINRSWNALQGVWASFQAAQQNLPESDLGTSITRERWLLPLFRELEYGRLQTTSTVVIDGRSYPISHAWEHVPVHLVSYKLELDKRAPGIAGAAAASPHSLVQVFLNRSEKSLWGFLSNGYRLRLMRDNASLTRQAYVEFDLEAMMDGEVYSDFVLLWLLCHQSRVEGEKPSDCWLERWMKIAEDQGMRALEGLRDGVEAAITALGLGFLEHPANHVLRDNLTSGALDAQDYYRQLLRLVYRLLFLFVAEDRSLLLHPAADEAARERYAQYYSTARLRGMAETFKGTRHPDLFEGLRLVMQLLGGEALTPSPSPNFAKEARGRGEQAEAGLGLVPLGSFLFSDAAVADVIGCQMSNQHLLDAIRALSLTYDGRAQVYRTVDYRNLGPEELGSVYESLLEMHPQINVPARRFALATAGGNERKTTGSYYTPSSLINALLDSALEPVLDEAAKAGETAILDLKICDPACGSGHFLIAAAGRIAKKLAERRTGEEEPPPAAVQQAKRDVISHCIYGVDINPMAVELCKVNLWMEALEPGKPLSFLDHRIQVGNSLLGTTPRLMANGIPDDAFNPIEGDDPKYAATIRKVNRTERKERERLATGQGDFLHLVEPPADYGYLTEAMHALDKTPDSTLEEVRRKEAQYAALANDPEYVKARLLADAWCAAFVWEKKQNGLPLPMTDLLYRRMEDDPQADNLEGVRQCVVELKERYGFFHWHVAFPDVFTVPDELQHAENEGAGWHGGFHVVLGNPPWERIKIQEKEWFAERAPQIASAPNAAARRRAIAELAERDPYLLSAFAADKRGAEGESHFVRASERYPLTGRGDVNTYTLFAESGRLIMNGNGRAGMILPSGIATDDTTKYFFQDLMSTRSLASLYDFENREGLFPAVDSRMKFSLVTMKSPLAEREQALKRASNDDAEFVFFALSVADLAEQDKRFTLSAEDIRLLNPNTGTTATFRSVRDAEITKAIYRRIPVLIQEEPLQNPWGISFLRMFDMSNDSHLFRTREQLEAAGGELRGNRFYLPHPKSLSHSPEEGERERDFQDSALLPSPLPSVGNGRGVGGEGKDENGVLPSPVDPLLLSTQHSVLSTALVFLPLYEAKMMHQFTHRWATYAHRLGEAPLDVWTLQPDDADKDAEKLLVRDMSPAELRDPTALALPRYWVEERAVTERIGDTGWMLGFRDIARSTDERTAIFGILPRAGLGNKVPILLADKFDPRAASVLKANAACFVFDFVARQKLGGTTMNFFYVKQFPVIPPHTYTPALLDFIVPRVLELTYTAWDLQPFAQDVGYNGAPFVWDEARRFLLRCELDALYFHLYGIGRDDADYILETFPIVRRKDEAAYGEYRTKRVILEMYEGMAALTLTPAPSPNVAKEARGRGENDETYWVPDVSEWRTWLEPPPADARVAHPPREGLWDGEG